MCHMCKFLFYNKVVSFILTGGSYFLIRNCLIKTTHNERYASNSASRLHVPHRTTTSGMLSARFVNVKRTIYYIFIRNKNVHIAVDMISKRIL